MRSCKALNLRYGFWFTVCLVTASSWVPGGTTYAVQRQISGEPEFLWCIQHVLYWVRTHKFVVKITKYVVEANSFD